MKINRRRYLKGAAALGGVATLVSRLGSVLGRSEEEDADPRVAAGFTPVVTPNGTTLPWVMKDGVKEFELVALPVKREFAPGMEVDCWGYNGLTPGPTIEAVEGDRIRILVSNELPEHTSIHWHGIFLPNGMDGVGGLTQKQIMPGETYAYEFTLEQHGTHMYHPHADETVQLAMGMMGFLIIHPRVPPDPPIDRDFCIFLAEWHIDPGTSKPNPHIMTDFNTFTFNSRAFPGTEHLIVKKDDRVRLRIANLSMDSHPIHIHGHRFWIVETDGGQLGPAAYWPETTVNVHPGSTRAVEFVADAPGDWAFHCHKTHHAMNAMSHDIPNMMGVDQQSVSGKIQRLGGFTVVKVREGLTSYQDPGWYQHPEGTVAWKVKGAAQAEHHLYGYHG